jgi:Gametolysin peptidase M11.
MFVVLPILQKKVYEKCSNGKLNFVPSPSFTYGVMEVNAPWNICGQLWIDAFNSLGIRMENYDADHMMVVMPDCVNWNNAAGWGQTPGSITWFPSAHASKPVTQVHEMGHNFGHRHSGKNGVSYADDTGYMGNKAMWTDEGSAMCFNAAKTWWFGWFSNNHRTVKVSSSSYSGILASPAQSAIAGSNDIVIRILAEGYGNKDLFVVFNLAAGANAGVVGSRNQIVIIEQSSATSESTWIADLSGGDSWQKANWGSGTLVVKNCAINWGTLTTAKLVIAYSSSSALNCNSHVTSPDVLFDNQSTAGQIPDKFDDTQLFTSSLSQTSQELDSPTSVCKDIPGWFDADGPSFNCEWYSSMDSELRCRHSKRHPNNGHTAMTACCVCGGGETVQVTGDECHDEPGWYDSRGKDCDWYEMKTKRCNRERHGVKGMTAKEACCICKNGQ